MKAKFGEIYNQGVPFTAEVPRVYVSRMLDAAARDRRDAWVICFAGDIALLFVDGGLK